MAAASPNGPTVPAVAPISAPNDATLQTQPTPSPAPAAKPSLSSLEGQLASQTSTALAQTDKLQGNVQDITSQFHNELGQLQGQAPKVPDVQPFKAPDQIPPAMAFGSKIAVMAGIASLFTRAPLTASLNALASGAQAINEGNALKYQRAFQEYKTNTEYAFKTFDAENKHYDDLVNLAKTDYDSAMNGVKTMASMTNDKSMMLAQEMKGIEGVEELTIKRQELALQAQEAQTKLIPGEIFHQALKEYEVKHGKIADAQTMSSMWLMAQYGFMGGNGSDGGATNANGMVDAIGHYRAPPITIGARNNPQNKAIMDAVFAKYPDYAAEKYQGIQKAWNSFTSGPDAKLLSSGNKAIQHLNLLQGAFNALKNGDVVMVNSFKQRWLKETGSALPTNFDAIAKVAADEVATFAVGTGGRGTALADRDKIAETISRSMSQGQGEGAIESYKGLMAGQMDAKRFQYHQIGLDSMKPFEEWLMPETVDALSRHGGPAVSKKTKDFSYLWGGK